MSHSIGAVLLNSWTLFEEQFVSLVPRVLASLLVLLVGLALGAVVRRVGNWLLVAARIDRRLADLGLTSALETVGIRNTVAVAARVLQAVIVFVAGMLALYSLDPRLASDLAVRFFVYLPHLALALGISGGGVLLARFLGRSVLIHAVNADLPAPRVLSGATRIGVTVVAMAIALEHLGIGGVTLTMAFAILFGGATLAAALALGLGLQDVIRRWVTVESAPMHQESGERMEHW
jgi:hypothetical protein